MTTKSLKSNKWRNAVSTAQYILGQLAVSMSLLIQFKLVYGSLGRATITMQLITDPYLPEGITNLPLDTSYSPNIYTSDIYCGLQPCSLGVELLAVCSNKKLCFINCREHCDLYFMKNCQISGWVRIFFSWVEIT